MRPGVGALAWTVIAIAGCGGTSRAEPVARASSTAACSDPDVTLHFAWPATLAAGVVGHDLTDSQNADGSHPMHGDSWADLRLVTGPEGPGRIVRFEPAGRTRLRSQGFAPDIGGARPAVHLDATGAVSSVEGAAAMQARIQQAVAQGELDRESGSILLENATDAAQRGTAAAHWDWLLHAWDGRTLSCGVPVRERAVVPSLSFGNATLETETELAYVGRAPCGSDAVGDGGCVGLEIHQRDVGGSATRAIADSQAGGEASVGHAAFVRVVRIVTEPATLVPHSVTFEEHWEITWRRGRESVTRRIRDEQTYTFDYAAPAPAQRYAIVVTRDGHPVTRPDTPRCRWITACCDALVGADLTSQMICASTMPEEGADCTPDDVAAVQGILVVRRAPVPPECATQPPP